MPASNRIQRPSSARLNLGLVFALLFRVVLILAAQWVLNFRPLMGAGAVYLLWLCLSHFFLQSANDAEAPQKPHQHQRKPPQNPWRQQRSPSR